MRAPFHPDPFEYSDRKHNLKHQGVGRNYGEEWEEALVETGASEPQKIRPVFNLEKMKWLRFVVAIVVVVLIGRLFQLQVVQGSFFEREAYNNRFRISTLEAPRGVMYDRNGVQLIENEPQFDVAIIPADFPRKSEEIKQVTEKLEPLISEPSGELQNKAKEINYGSYIPVIVKEDVGRDIALLVESMENELPGISVEKNPNRKYAYSQSLAHIIGYTGKINKQEYDEKIRKKEEYLQNDRIGKAGIELSYENTLRGKFGKRHVEVDSRGKEKKILATKDPEPGQDLVLSIDVELQEYIQQELEAMARARGTEKGAVVAMDPNTGEVISMVSIPSYDNNAFAKGISSEDYSTLVNNETKPLLNRAVNGLYPPGSIVKPIVALAGLEEGLITEATTVHDKGKIIVPNKYNPDIVYQFVGWKLDGLGIMDVYGAIAKSSDIYFYYLGGGFEEDDFVGLGAKGLYDYYDKFHFGNQVGIDLPTESNGTIPTPEWKVDLKDEVWYLGDNYNLAIGQGDLLVTPLQAAVANATIANGGIMHKPRLVKKTINSNTGEVREFQPQIIKENIVKSENISIVKRAMRETVLEGSARSLQSLPFTVAGKTGTAQFANNTKTHAWFTSFAPYENPEIAMVVLVEGGGGGTETAVPLSGKILDKYFELKEARQQQANE